MQSRRCSSSSKLKLSSAISFFVIAILFGVIYKLLPRIKLSWRDVTIGALGTGAGLFIVEPQHKGEL